jgi:hypothetical protein
MCQEKRQRPEVPFEGLTGDVPKTDTDVLIQEWFHAVLAKFTARLLLVFPALV